MEQELAAQLIHAAKLVEEKLDEHISQLDQVGKTSDESELEELRRKRILQLKKAQDWKQELASNGHGRLDELMNEPEFFAASKKSERLVCHFSDSTSRASPIIDKAMEKLATKYYGTRFVKVNADRVPFLIKRLNIRRLPTLGIAINAQMKDFVRVIDEFGANIEREGISLDALEARLGRSNAIDYRPPPTATKGKTSVKICGSGALQTGRSIRDRASSGSDDSCDW